MAKKSVSNTVPKEVQDEIDVLEIRLKQLRKQSVSKNDAIKAAAAIKRERESIRDELLKAIPKGVYCSLAGRQQKVVDDFGNRYDVAITGPVINLFEVISTLHSRVSEFAEIARPYLDGEDADLQRIKLKEEINKLQRQSEMLSIDIRTKMAELVKRSDVVDSLDWLSGQLRSLGMRLHREFGPTAQDAFNEFLEAMAVELDGGQLSL